MRNQKGFILTSTLIILPVVLTTMLGVVLSIGLIKKRIERNHLCHHSVMDIQTSQAQHLNHLMSLNPEARRLQKQRKLADKSLKAALRTGNPKLIAVAKSYHLLVKARQFQLRSRQQNIMRQARTSMDDQIFQSKRRYTRLKSKLKTILRPLTLPVQSHNKHLGSPTYKVRMDVEKRQIIRLHWLWKMPEEWITVMNRLQVSNFHLSGQCGGTLRKRSQKWRGELIAAKY